MDFTKFDNEILYLYLKRNFSISSIVEVIYNRLNLKSIYFKTKLYSYVYSLLIERGIYNLGGLY